MSTYVPRTPPPLPTAPVPIRPVERRPSPFAAVRDNVNPEGSFTYRTDRQRLKAQREARKVLDELDARRRGASLEIAQTARREQNRARAAARVPAEPKARRRPTTSVLPDEKLLELFEQGKSCLQIERMTGVNQRTIRSRAHALGVHEFPTTRAAGLKRTDITADGMRQLRSQGLGWRDIAAHYGVSYATIRRHRDRAGVHPTEKGSQAA